MTEVIWLRSLKQIAKGELAFKKYTVCSIPYRWIESLLTRTNRSKERVNVRCRRVWCGDNRSKQTSKSVFMFLLNQMRHNEQTQMIGRLRYMLSQVFPRFFLPRGCCYLSPLPPLDAVYFFFGWKGCQHVGRNFPSVLCSEAIWPQILSYLSTMLLYQSQSANI